MCAAQFISFMEEALKCAKMAIMQDEVPVGAVLVRDGSIVASAHNCVELFGNPIQHAEIMLVQYATHLLRCKYLDECHIYVTLQPCPMCLYALLIARVKRIYFGAYAAASSENNDGLQGYCGKIGNTEIYGGIMEEECRELLRRFFTQKR